MPEHAAINTHDQFRIGLFPGIFSFRQIDISSFEASPIQGFMYPGIMALLKKMYIKAWEYLTFIAIKLN